MVNRLIAMLPKLISSYLVGFVPGYFAAMNIRKVWYLNIGFYVDQRRHLSTGNGCKKVMMKMEFRDWVSVDLIDTFNSYLMTHTYTAGTLFTPFILQKAWVSCAHFPSCCLTIPLNPQYALSLPNTISWHTYRQPEHHICTVCRWYHIISHQHPQECRYPPSWNIFTHFGPYLVWVSTMTKAK